MQGPARLRARVLALPAWGVDGVLALVILGVDLWFNGFTSMPKSGLPHWLEVLGLVLGTLPLTLRRRAPRSVLAVVGTVAVAATCARIGESELGLCVALFTVAARCPRRQFVVALALVCVPKLAAEILRGAGLEGIVPLLVFAYAVAFVLGDQRRSQWALTRELARRAAELEREREHRVRLATADERASIARDLHDVVAHSVSVMVLHTAAARRMLAKDPERADRSFAQVEETGRQSLTELRQLLGLLRDDTRRADLTPQPRLAYLDELVDGFRVAGLEVEVDRAPGGDPAVSDPLRVLLVDDQELMRAGFRMILDAEAGLEVVGEVADGLEAVELAGRLRPDVVLMDIRMPRMDGVQATRVLAGADATTPSKVLVLTTFDHRRSPGG
jgi:signal transduction histidine kinase